jgi:hypothetical protein
MELTRKGDQTNRVLPERDGRGDVYFAFLEYLGNLCQRNIDIRKRNVELPGNLLSQLNRHSAPDAVLVLEGVGGAIKDSQTQRLGNLVADRVARQGQAEEHQSQFCLSRQRKRRNRRREKKARRKASAEGKNQHAGDAAQTGDPSASSPGEDKSGAEKPDKSAEPPATPMASQNANKRGE